jgi:hypothetical protein
MIRRVGTGGFPRDVSRLHVRSDEISSSSALNGATLGYMVSLDPASIGYGWLTATRTSASAESGQVAGELDGWSSGTCWRPASKPPQHRLKP